MIKILSLSLLLLANVHALDVLKCDKCSISKEYIKCSVYVENKGDKSKQDSCLLYGESLYAGNSESTGCLVFFYLRGILTGLSSLVKKDC